jgi:hypothetical protein
VRHAPVMGEQREGPRCRFNGRPLSLIHARVHYYIIMTTCVNPHTTLQHDDDLIHHFRSVPAARIEATVMEPCSP